MTIQQSVDQLAAKLSRHGLVLDYGKQAPDGTFKVRFTGRAGGKVYGLSGSGDPDDLERKRNKKK